MVEIILESVARLGHVGRTIADRVRTLKDRRFNSDRDYNIFLRYCCDVGLLDIVYLMFEDIDKNSLRLEEFKKKYPNITRIQSFSEDRLILTIQKISIDGMNTDNDFVIAEMLVSFFKELKPSEASAKDNMILNAILVLALRSNQQLVSSELCINLFKFLHSAKNINSTRRESCILMIVEYCCYYEIEDFFKLPKKLYNHCPRVLSRLVSNTFLNQDSAQVITNDYLNRLRKFNNFKTSTPKKVAICISGIYRNHEKAILSIKENLVDPLNADVFIHTWDNMSVWSGLGGSPHCVRVFSKKSKNVLPKEYYWLAKLKDVLPLTYPLLQTPINKPINIKDVFGLLEPTKVVVESEEHFIEGLGDLTGFTRLRGITNQIKMFHGMKQSFDLALKNGNYDYIIRCRPDLGITSKVSQQIIEDLQNNRIYAGVGPQGISDGLFIFSSSMAYSLSSFIFKMYESQELSPFVNFPEYDSHNLLGAWLIYNNFTCSKPIIKGTILSNPEVPIPGLKEAVKDDYSRLSEEDKRIFGNFIDYLIKRNG